MCHWFFKHLQFNQKYPAGQCIFTPFLVFGSLTTHGLSRLIILQNKCTPFSVQDKGLIFREVICSEQLHLYLCSWECILPQNTHNAVPPLWRVFWVEHPTLMKHQTFLQKIWLLRPSCHQNFQWTYSTWGGYGIFLNHTIQKITEVYNQVHILYLKCRLFEYWLTSTACCQWCSVGDKVILDIQCTFVEQSNSEPCQQLSSSFQLWIYPGNPALGENAPFHSHLETKLKEMITNKT